VFCVWAAWCIGRRIAGDEWGIVAGLQFRATDLLTYMQLSSHAEGVTITLAMVTMATAIHLMDPRPGQVSFMGMGAPRAVGGSPGGQAR
jgi:hypothetical protein